MSNVAVAKSKEPAIHLFRRLLRASSYLPDEFARAYTRSFIKSQFRRAKKPSNFTPARLKKARQSLKTLQRAADGNIQSLEKVLQATYGRTGRRRRELLNELLRADGTTTSPSESLTLEGIDLEGNWMSERPVLMMFIKNQAANNPQDSNRPPLRQVELAIPKNIWGRQVPLKRRKNIVRRLWASTLDKILPPLPELEWNRLRDLATGVIPFQGPPPRRTPVNSHQKEESANILDIAPFLKSPVLQICRSGKDEEIMQRNNHEITSRYMRRRWAGVWSQCPLMSYNAETMKWSITWGGSRSAASKGMAGSAGNKDLELFDRMGPSDSASVVDPQTAQFKNLRKQRNMIASQLEKKIEELET